MNRPDARVVEAWDPGPPGPGWIKADLHLHSAEDPCDIVEPDARGVIDRATLLGFGALSITLHRAVLDDPALRRQAAARGLLWIPGAELRIEGADVVVLNLSPAEAREIRTFADLRRWRGTRGADGFVLLPHPFYLIGGSMGGRRAALHADLFDAVEICHFHAPFLDLNRPAIRFAQRHRLPMVATSDAHRLGSFGRHFTWIDTGGDRTPRALFDAIRAGRLRAVSPACSPLDFAEILWDATVGSFIRNRLSRRRVPPVELPA